MFEKAISQFYSKAGKVFCKNFSDVISAMLSSGSSNTAKIAVEMSKLNNKSFKHKLIKTGDKIPIKIDFTTSEDNFLILCASIIVADKAVPIYFTMRCYPVCKDMIDQKRMERAFFKCLKNFLSKKYSYIIVADRGFDIENLKIKKYDRFKRMIFCSVVAYSLMILTGDFINTKLISLKKNSPTFLELISAYFNLPKKLLARSS